MAKKQISIEKQYQILRSIQLIGVMAQMIDVEFQKHIIDTKHRSPIINNHARKIKQSTDAIIGLLKQSGFTPKDSEKFNYEYVLNMYEVFEHFTMMDYEQLEEYIVGLRKLLKQ